MFQLISSASLIKLLFQYRYFFLYPAVAIEGPLMTMAAGFLVSLRVMNPIIALLVVVAGDMTSDLFFFCFGHLGRIWKRASWITKILNRFHFQPRGDKFIRFFDRHGGKAIIFGKLTHSLAGIVFIGAGYFKISPWRTAWYSFSGALIKGAALIYLGYLAGSVYERYTRRFEWWALILSIATVVLIATFFYLPRSIRYGIFGSEEDIISEDEKNTSKT